MLQKGSSSSANDHRPQKLAITVILVPAGLFCCFHSPPNSAVDCPGSLMCVCDCFFVCMRIRTGDLGLDSLIQRTFVESAQNLTPKNSQGGRKAEYVTVTHPFW